MNYTLLAHNPNGREALVQHGTEQVVYLYQFADETTYQLVPMDYTVDQDEWVTEYDHKVRVPTIDDIVAYIQHSAHVHFATPGPLSV